MRRQVGTALLVALVLMQCGSGGPVGIPSHKAPCVCDSACLYNVVTSPGFGGVSAWDDARISADTIYGSGDSLVRALWFRDIESPDTTRFTRSFNSYFRGTYSASAKDFINFYHGRRDVPLAFQLGPNDDLWAFHSFVVKPVDECYLISHSYYRHGRFTFKAFGFLDKGGLDTLREKLLAFTQWPLDTTERYYYELGICDNEKHVALRSNMKEPEDTTSARSRTMHRLYDHLDHSIRWFHSYD